MAPKKALVCMCGEASCAGCGPPCKALRCAASGSFLVACAARAEQKHKAYWKCSHGHFVDFADGYWDRLQKKKAQAANAPANATPGSAHAASTGDSVVFACSDEEDDEGDGGGGAAVATGGVATGGVATGGVATGGVATGGAATADALDAMSNAVPKHSASRAKREAAGSSVDGGGARDSALDQIRNQLGENFTQAEKANAAAALSAKEAAAWNLRERARQRQSEVEAMQNGRGAARGAMGTDANGTPPASEPLSRVSRKKHRRSLSARDGSSGRHDGSVHPESIIDDDEANASEAATRVAEEALFGPGAENMRHNSTKNSATKTAKPAAKPAVKPAAKPAGASTGRCTLFPPPPCPRCAYGKDCKRMNPQASPTHILSSSDATLHLPHTAHSHCLPPHGSPPFRLSF